MTGGHRVGSKAELKPTSQALVTTSLILVKSLLLVSPKVK